MDPVFVTVARVALSGLFAQAAAHKLVDRRRFFGIVADYRLMPGAFVTPAAALLIAAELGLTVALLVPRTAAAAACFGALLLGLYAAAIAINLLRGRRSIDCGCGGPGETLHPGLIGRNVLLIGVCGLAAAASTDRNIGLLDGVTIASALGVLALLWQAVAELAHGGASIASDASDASIASDASEVGVHT